MRRFGKNVILHPSLIRKEGCCREDIAHTELFIGQADRSPGESEIANPLSGVDHDSVILSDAPISRAGATFPLVAVHIPNNRPRGTRSAQDSKLAGGLWLDDIKGMLVP
jgi:hypothetical protein